MKTISKLSAIILLSLISFTVKSQTSWSQVGTGSPTRPVYTLFSESTNSLYIGTYNSILTSTSSTLLKWDGFGPTTELNPLTSYGPYFSENAPSSSFTTTGVIATNKNSGVINFYTGSVWLPPNTYTVAASGTIFGMKNLNTYNYILNGKLSRFVGGPTTWVVAPNTTAWSFSSINQTSNSMLVSSNNLYMASRCTNTITNSSYLAVGYNGSSTMTPIGGTVSTSDRADGIAVYTSTSTPEFYVTSKGSGTINPMPALRKCIGSSWIKIDSSLYGQPGICVYNGLLYYAVSVALNSQTINIRAYDGNSALTTTLVTTVVNTGTGTAAVNVMISHNNELYIGGNFTTVNGTNGFNNIARYYVPPIVTGISEQNNVISTTNISTKLTEDAIIVDFEKITPIYVYDVTGKLVYSGKSDSHTVYVPSGMYFITGEFKTVKIIK